jgi:hypothetical protein
MRKSSKRNAAKPTNLNAPIFGGAMNGRSAKCIAQGLRKLGSSKQRRGAELIAPCKSIHSPNQ